MIQEFVELVRRDGSDNLAGAGSSPRPKPRPELYEAIGESEILQERKWRPSLVLPLTGLRWERYSYCRSAPKSLPGGKGPVR